MQIAVKDTKKLKVKAEICKDELADLRTQVSFLKSEVLLIILITIGPILNICF